MDVGQWFRVHNAPDSGNNGIFYIASKAGDTVTIGGVQDFMVATTSASVVIQAESLKNGTTLRFFTIERAYEDLGDAFFRVEGQAVNTFDLNLSSNSITTGSFGFLGKEGVYSSTTVASSIVPAATSDVLNSTNNVGQIYEGGFDSLLTTALRSLSFSLSNNLRQQNAIGNRTAIGIGNGSLEITGTIDAYFDSIALAQKFINHTSTSLSFRVTDADGNVYVVTFPKVYLSTGDAPAGGIDQDVSLSISFVVARDPATSVMMRVDRLEALS